MNRIETGYRFPEIDRNAQSYLEDYPECGEMIEPFGFRTIAELKELLRRKTEGTLSEEALSEIAKTVFRNKPDREQAVLPKDRHVADFIYQM